MRFSLGGKARAQKPAAPAEKLSNPHAPLLPLKSSAPARLQTGNQLTFDLPLPPSVNRFQARLGNSSNAVQAWWRQADRYVLADMRRIRAGSMHGEFACHVTWDASAFGDWDIDNRIKPLLDYLQRIEVIPDDRLCRFLTVAYGEAPLGCRVFVKRWGP